MDSELLLDSRVKRKTLDSPSDDLFAEDPVEAPANGPDRAKDPEKGPDNRPERPNGVPDSNVQDTTRVSTTDSYEYYYKLDESNKKSQTPLTQQFLSNFLVEFSDEELAAKRTVETIYAASGSFAYTYRSLDEAFFSRASNFSTLMPFVKAIASVADESLLLRALEPASRPEPREEAPAPDRSLLLNFELIMLGLFRPLRDKLRDVTGLRFPMTWRQLSDFVAALFKREVLSELHALFANLYGTEEIYADDFKRHMVDLTLYLTSLNDALSDGNRAKKPKRAGEYSLADCVATVNFLGAQLDTLRRVLALSVKNITNTPATDSLERALGALEADLAGQGLLRPDPAEVADKVSCVKTLLEEDALPFLGSQAALGEAAVCRDKFNHFYAAYQEELQRRSEASSEYKRKAKLKRDAVQYVLDRLADLESGTLPGNFKNPFYTVGLAPKMCNRESLKKYSRKLKMLLHPDTEHDPEWKNKAERAFKEASLSLDQCLKLVDTFSASMLRVGPEPPYLADLGIGEPPNFVYAQAPKPPEEPREPREHRPAPAGPAFAGPAFTGKPQPENIFLFFPHFEVRCENQKVGALAIEVPLGDLVDTKVWQDMGRNKFVSVVVRRPLHSEPITNQVSPDMLSSAQKHPLTEPLKNLRPVFRVEAVQPFQLGTPWRYFVGVKLSGDRGASLMHWKSTLIELQPRARSLANIARLLSTFVNASFVGQSDLQDKLTSAKPLGSKAEAEEFLQECIKRAHKWAEET